MFNTLDPLDGAIVFNHTINQIKFGDTLFASLQRPENLKDNVRFIKVSEAGQHAYNSFTISKLASHIQTSHALIIHTDGFPINLAKWNPDFLNYDYIGALWPKEWNLHPEYRNGNGAGLRSKRLMEETAKLSYPDYSKPEDTFVSIDNRDFLESKGIKFAPNSLAADFCLEAFNSDYPRTYADVFMFHGSPRNYNTNDIIDRVLKHNLPQSATSAHCMAHALRKLGRKVEAKNAYEQALHDDPLNESARVEFAVFEAEEGQIVPALTLLHAGIQLNPMQARVWETGGALSLRQRDTLEFALDWSGEALKHLPDHPTLQRQRAEILLLNGHAHEALPLWCEMSRPNDADSSSGLILCRLFAGESQSAVPPDREMAVSQDLIRRYRQSVEMGLDGWVHALHQRVDTLRKTLPSAARFIDLMSSSD